MQENYWKLKQNYCKFCGIVRFYLNGFICCIKKKKGSLYPFKRKPNCSCSYQSDFWNLMLFSNLHSLNFASKLANTGLYKNEESKQAWTLTFKVDETVLFTAEL